LATQSDIILVPLTRGYFATIDAADAPEILRHKWAASVRKGRRAVYAVRQVRVDGKMQCIWMHRQIAGTPAGMLTDHKDRDGLNNRRSNLRAATRAQNQVNADRPRGQFLRGTRPARKPGVWQAYIQYEKRRLHLGSFPTEAAAHAAYLEAAKRLHGEFRHPDFITTKHVQGSHPRQR
jgi:hypothetical protein